MFNDETLFGGALIAMETALREQLEHEGVASVALAESLVELAEYALDKPGLAEIEPAKMVEFGQRIIEGRGELVYSLLTPEQHREIYGR
tara:strand:- start:175 stop:441 length:267 start_codon:yes stop_codon:yes gene_type:complete